jgi:hypothetical protein
LQALPPVDPLSTILKLPEAAALRRSSCRPIGHQVSRAGLKVSADGVLGHLELKGERRRDD